MGLTQVLAAEYGPENIRVKNQHGGSRSFRGYPGSRAFVANLHAMKRIAEPKEIARSALYLASDASGFTPGSALMADGGVSVNRV